MRIRMAFTALSMLIASAGATFATDYYAAPPNSAQSCLANGSRSCPWVGLKAAFESKKLVGGDRLLLLNGNYGELDLDMIAFKRPVIIESLSRKNAHFDVISIGQGTRNITFRNLSVWPTDPSRLPSTPLNNIVFATDTASNIIVDGLDVRSGADADKYMSWSKSEWLGRKSSGITLLSPNSAIENSSLMGVYFGAVIIGNNSKMLHNRVVGFSADAYRVLGNNSIVSGNVAKNCFSIDDNHADALQSWADPGSVVKNLTIEGNTFIEWATSAVSPLRCQMQGIGFFDGPYENVIIQNNVIASTTYHGISVYGGRNVRIVNNTVVNNDGENKRYPWIGAFANKNGTPPKNILVANNLAMSINVPEKPPAVTVVDNSVLTHLRADFRNISAFDYRPTARSGFIGSADPAYAPRTDITGAVRPAGAKPDRGAYEVGATGK